MPVSHGGTLRASVVVSPSVFSPKTGAVQIEAVLQKPAPLGLQVMGSSGEVLGWLAPERPRTALRLSWRGMLGGTRLPDGAYDLGLVSKGLRLAQARFRVDTTAPTFRAVRIGNGSLPFLGDGPLLATISPNGDGLRDYAVISFALSEPATVTLDANRTAKTLQPAASQTFDLPAGPSTIEWDPPAGLGPRTYLLRLTAADDAGNRRMLGRTTVTGTGPRGPVVRLQGVDAAFDRTSYKPGEQALLRVSTDALSFTLQLFRSGPESAHTDSDSVMNGVPVGIPQTVDWQASRDAPGEVRVAIPSVGSGLYFAQLTAADGRVGYAPFVVTPASLGERRVAVVLPTRTWQAYNFYDANGDGWGDTWYAGGPAPAVRLNRPFLHRGVPPFFRRYDLPFLHWLTARGREVDVLTDDELETVSADALSAAYDLIVFPGHHEYVTDAEFAAVTGYRDRGGNLIFLSANNFFWRVDRDGDTMRRTRQWRDLGKPEAALIGVQYRANDDGTRQAPFIVRDTSPAPWLWEGTGLTVGSLIGADIGGFGTEIDGTSAASPPGTIVLAEVPDLFGPGKTAQMTYYETPYGSKVFAAGTLDFGGSVNHDPQDRLLQNLWARLSQP